MSINDINTISFCANVQEELPASNKLIVCDYNLIAEKEFIEKLQREDPEHLRAIMDRGNQIVGAIENKNLPLFLGLLKQEYFFWHIVKAFKQAVLDVYIEGIECMIANGLNVEHEALKGTIPNVVDDLTTKDAFKVIDILVSSGVTIDDNSEKQEYKTALHIAVCQEDFDLVQGLVARGADVNAVDKNGKMPLNYIEDEDNRVAEEIKQFLKDKGAESDWRTPLRDRFCI